jgi:protein-L-isoaspartate O-methyltransferase
MGLCIVDKDWRVRDISDCDLELLPEIISWPELSSQSEALERLSHMGALDNLVVKDTLSITPRGAHALPLSENIKNIESSSLKLPWWVDLGKPNSLLPGLFETCQIFQMVEISSNDKILLIGPRGNWWTEVILHLGVSKIHILEIDDFRRESLKNRWEDLRLDIVSKALNCDIVWSGLEYMTIDSEDLFDKILITGGLKEIPTELFKKLKNNGEVWAPIGLENNTILQRITKTTSNGIEEQYMAMWDVDMLGNEAESVLCHSNEYEKGDTVHVEESPDLIREAWLHANDNPTKDRIGPNSLLEIIREVWNSTDILLEYDNITLKDSIARDLFRMGHVLQKIGVFRLAAEHHGTSYLLSPSAESACYLGMTYSIDNEDALAWQRRAIETDPNFGESWNEIGEIMMKRGEIENSINWFREAIVSKNYSKRGEAWINLTRAHMEINQNLSAFFAAQKAVDLFPNNAELIELLSHLGEDLV